MSLVPLGLIVYVFGTQGLIVNVFGRQGFNSLCELNFKGSTVELSCLEALSQVLSFKDCEI